MRYIIQLFLIILICISAYSQNGKLISGPLQGHITATTAKLSLIVSKTKTVTVSLLNKGVITKNIVLNTDTLKAIGKLFPIVVEFDNLIPGTTYEIALQLDKKSIDKKFKLQTLKQLPVADFSFLTGSCALQLPAVLKPFTRMGSDRIFKYMLTVPADFMIWLGDYTYYIKRKIGRDDFASAAGMWNRQIKTRKKKHINKFLIEFPQYAIWDDHDYGAYDGDENFVLKDTSLFMYKNLWANPSYGLPEVKGIFTSFRKYDAEFFLLDDRFYRTEPNIKNCTMLGQKQLNWLFESLKKSEATFKFIVLGTQFLNPYAQDECYNQFPGEKKEIYDFLEKNSIRGVVFITGDAHYSDLQKEERKNTYPLYDFTCSPLSTFLNPPNPMEKTNTARVLGTLTCHRNFGRISVTGSLGKRVCSIELYDDSARLLWKHNIPEEELK